MEKNKENINILEASDLQPSSSVEIKKTTKGVNLSVKIYACDNDSEVKHAVDMATKNFDELMKKYGVE